MSQQTVTLRIVGENGKLVASVRTSKAELVSLGKTAEATGKQAATGAAGIDKTGGAAERTGRKARTAKADVDSLGKSATDTGVKSQAGARGVDKMGEAAERSGRRMSLLGGTLGQIKGLIAGYAGLQGISALVRSVDTYSDIVGKLKQVTIGEQELAVAKAETFRIAQQTYQSLDATVTLYSRSAMALAQYNVSQTKVAELTQTINQGLLVSRATTAESASAVLQLSQALGAGALRGEEFNAVNEAGPRLMQALADSLGVARGELKKMAEDGELTIDKLLKAWTGPEAQKIAQEAEKVPLTIARAWQTAKNEMLQFVGEADQANGVSSTIAQGIALIGGSLGLLATAALAVAAAYGVKLVAALVRGASAMLFNNAQTIGLQLSLLRLEGVTGVAAVRTLGLATAQGVAAVASRALGAALTFVGGPFGLLVLALGAAALGIYKLVQAEKERQREFDEGIAQTQAMTAKVRELIAARQELASLDPVTLTASIGLQGDAESQLAAEEAKLAGLREQLATAERGMLASDVGFDSGDIQMAQQASLAYARYSSEVATLRDQIKALAPETEALRAATDDLAAANGPAMTQALAAASAGMRQMALQPGIVDGLGLQEDAIYGVSTAAQTLSANLAAISTADALAKTLSAELQQQGKTALQQAKEVGRTAIDIAQTRAAEAEAAGLAAGWTAEQLASQQALNAAAIAGLQTLEQAKGAEKARNDQQRAAEAAASKAARAAEQARNEQIRLGEQQAASQALYVAQIELAEAALQGPLAVAEVEHRQRIAQLTEDLAAHNVQQDAFNRAKAVAAEQLSRTTAEIAREQDVMGQVADDYRELIYLSGLSASARRVEEEVIQRVNDAKRAGRVLSAGEIEDLRKFIKESQRVVVVKDAHQQAAEDYQRMWQGAISSVSAAFGDWMTGGIKSFKDFGRALGDIAKRFISDIVGKFVDGQLQQASTKWVASLTSKNEASGNGGNGSGNSGAGMWSRVFSSFSGGFNSAGSAGGGFWSSLIGGFKGILSEFSGSFAGIAKVIKAVYGGLTGATGAAGAGAATGSGVAAGTSTATAAAAGVSWIPIVGAIVVAIIGSWVAYKNGWRMEGQKSDMTDWFKSKGMYVGALDNEIVGGTDSALRALGFKDSWAAALSGSSLQTKMFGHKTPKLEGQGFQGSIGFGGFDGQSTADIKAKGGWFRSDKRWTETGAMNATLDRAFDNLAQGVAMRAVDLADQMGIDIGGALAAVKIDIAKVNLDADPEKAREQISEMMGALMEELSAEAVKALGFTRLLDDGFQAGEIMGALSASIVLVTGSADNLGRALSALEVENVARAVEYFESMAIKNGGSLGDEIGRTVGLLGEYSSLITGVDTELQTRGLNQYQSAQLQIELQYRNQIKSANQLAKALGLTGARSEDLAKIEQLRAVNMADLQTQMEAQKNTFLDDLGLSDLSTLRDDEKLTESMQLLRDAVGSGDLQRAQQMSQTVLGLGRNLYASGNDYGSLYGEVTGLLGGMTTGGMDGFTDAGLDTIADLLTGLPDGIAAAMFNLLYGPAVADTSVLTPPPIAPPPPNGLTPGRPGRPALGPGDDGTMTNALLLQILAATQATAQTNAAMAHEGPRAELAAYNTR